MLPVLLGIAQRGERVGGLARLRHDEHEAVFRQRRFAVAELGRDIDVDRHAGEPFEPIFGGQPGVIGGAAGREGDPVDRGGIERQLEGQRHRTGRKVEVMGQGAADDLRLLVDLLGHEMPVIALVDQKGAGLAFLARPADRPVGLVEELGAAAMQHHPVAFLEIGDLVGERRQGQSVGSEKHLAFAEADRQRCAASRPDQQIVTPVEQEGERESAAQAGQSRRNGFARRLAGFEFIGDQMGHDLGVGFGREVMALGDQFVPQFAEVLDDAVMHDGQALAGMRMRIVLARAAVRGPARMADADGAAQRLFRQAQLRGSCSFPGARRRVSTPSSSVAMPAES